MTTAYSPFFASGLLATSFYSGNEYPGSLKPSQICVDETRLMAEMPSTTSLSRLTINQWSPGSNGDASTTSSPLSVSRHRRRRSSLSAAISMTLTGVKPSPRDATVAASRSYATLGTSSLPQRRTNGGSFSASKLELVEAVHLQSPTADSDVPKRSRTLRRSTVSSALSPLKLKRSDRRGPSPVPPPSSPLPPVPPLPTVTSTAQRK